MGKWKNNLIFEKKGFDCLKSRKKFKIVERSDGLASTARDS